LKVQWQAHDARNPGSDIALLLSLLAPKAGMVFSASRRYFPDKNYEAQGVKSPDAEPGIRTDLFF